MKALETTKLVELTIVIAIETYGTDNDGVCAMDYITANHEAEIVGWSERTLTVKYKDEMETVK
jgi:hypothetical protein